MMAALAESRFDDAYEAGARGGQDQPPQPALRAALGDPGRDRRRTFDAARRTHDELVVLGVRGPALDAARDVEQASILALEGRWPEAAGSYRDATRRLRDLGADFDLALALLEVVRVGPPTDGLVRAAADEARALFTRMGAIPYLAQLDGALDRSTDGTAGAGQAGTRTSSPTDAGAVQAG